MNVICKNFCVFAILTMVLAASCASSGESQGAYPGAVSYRLVIEGFEWGPSVTKLILTATDSFRSGSFDSGSFVVKSTQPGMEGPVVMTRKVTAAYLCNEEGTKLSSGQSKHLALDLATGYGVIMTIPGIGNIGAAIDGSSPFSFDAESGYNSWGDLAVYTVDLAPGETIGVGKARYDGFSAGPASYSGRIVPETALFSKSANTFNGITLQTAAYQPEAFRKDRGKNALIIWLHGAGEGGTDVDIALLGNDVTELGKDPIQGYFRTGGLAGAYVLVVQTPTMWMDSGDGKNHGGDRDSIYTAALKDTIDNYISVNGDIDAGRIYLGGCSNGGYMTMNMLVTYPGYFAAAWPVCEAYMDSFIDDQKLASLKAVPIWFTASADDSVVVPANFVSSTYVRLLRAGAENVHFSFFENVSGKDQPDAVYMGHWSWIYALQDRCLLDQNAQAIKSASNTTAALALVKAPSTAPVQVNGANVSLWGWLAGIRRIP